MPPRARAANVRERVSSGTVARQKVIRTTPGSRRHFLFSAESRPSINLGRSPDSEGAAIAASRFAFPGCCCRVACEATPSLTVAGPRRIRTGFPVRPVMGTQTCEGITMCYKFPLPRVSVLDITGKPVKDRRGSATVMRIRCFVYHLTLRSGKVKQPARKPLSARRPTQVHCLSFCGEQKTCHSDEKSLTSRPSRNPHVKKRSPTTS